MLLSQRETQREQVDTADASHLWGATLLDGQCPTCLPLAFPLAHPLVEKSSRRSKTLGSVGLTLLALQPTAHRSHCSPFH
ncbi:hypothetical protein [Nostoc sp.]|uniref:hypothetical protein n=1 Tax=Nostoc sp. TaxID=1180 RepID=UPI002FFC68C3